MLMIEISCVPYQAEKYTSSEIRGVNIKGTKKGKYEVLYLNSDNSVVHLGEVDVY